MDILRSLGARVTYVPGEFMTVDPRPAEGTGISYRDSQRLRDRLGEADVQVTYLEQPGGWHCYPMVWRGPAAQRARRAQISFVRDALGFDAPVNEGRRAAAH